MRSPSVSGSGRSWRVRRGISTQVTTTRSGRVAQVNAADARHRRRIEVHEEGRDPRRPVEKDRQLPVRLCLGLLENQVAVRIEIHAGVGVAQEGKAEAAREAHHHTGVVAEPDLVAQVGIEVGSGGIDVDPRALLANWRPLSMLVRRYNWPTMTELLQQALAKLEKLPVDVQNAVAESILADLADDRAWVTSFETTSAEQWDRLAALPRQENREYGIVSHGFLPV